MCKRTHESFSPADYLASLNELHASYRADLEEKLSAMDSLNYSTESLNHVCVVWRREPSLGTDIIAIEFLTVTTDSIQCYF